MPPSIDNPGGGSERQPLRGIFPIAPTPFTASGDLDLDGQRRVLDCMVDQGVDGICILANYSEQFLLTDDERSTLLDACLSHVAGRVPVIVTCSHYSTRIARERGRAAARAGAAMLMLMPPYHGATLRADEKGMLEHFAGIAEASGQVNRLLLIELSEAAVPHAQPPHRRQAPAAGVEVVALHDVHHRRPAEGVDVDTLGDGDVDDHHPARKLAAGVERFGAGGDVAFLVDGVGVEPLVTAEVERDVAG